VVKAGLSNGKKVAVVGSGPAGHSAAYQLARLGYKVTIFEKSPKAGGLNRGGIPDWVLPQDILDREIERLVELGITIKTNVEVGKDITWDQLKKDYDACVLAVGLIDPNSVRAEGEDKEGVHYGLPFLRDIGMGTSKVKLGARVGVIGGGNTAIDCAREALRQGAVEVTMITIEAISTLSGMEDTAGTYEFSPASALAQAPAPRQFEFVHNADIRPVLEQAYADSKHAIEQADYDLALRTSCGILEAIVTDALEFKGAEALAAKGAPAGKIADWSFQTRLAVAEKVGLIRGGCARLPAIARTYRDHSDVGDASPSNASVSEREARVSGQVLHVVMRDLYPTR